MVKNTKGKSETSVRYESVQDLALDVDQIRSITAHWERCLYDCSPIDRVAVEDSIEAVYQQLKLDKPTIVYLDSPFQLAVIPWLAKEITGLDMSRGRELGENLSNLLAGRIYERVSNPWAPKRVHLWEYVLENQLDNSGVGRLMRLAPELCQPVLFQIPDRRLRVPRNGKIFDRVWDSICNHPIWDQLCSDTGKSAPDQHFWKEARNNFLVDGFTIDRGCMWLWNRAYEFAYVDVLQSLPWYKPSQKLDQQWKEWTSLVQLTHGFLMFDNICFVCERPTRLTVDDEGRLHNASAPALEFADGFCLYAWHADRIEWNHEHVIQNHSSITIQLIDSEPDPSTRTAMLMLYGEERFLPDVGAVEIHRDRFGVLYRRAPSGSRKADQLVKVNSPNDYINGVQRTYFFPVSEEVSTAKEAVSMSFWINPLFNEHCWEEQGESFHDELENRRTLIKRTVEDNQLADLHNKLCSINPLLPGDYEPYGKQSRLDENGIIWSDCSGGCKFWQPLQAMPLDWGVCTNKKSHRCGLLTFEHQGCPAFEAGEESSDD